MAKRSLLFERPSYLFFFFNFITQLNVLYKKNDIILSDMPCLASILGHWIWSTRLRTCAM